MTKQEAYDNAIDALHAAQDLTSTGIIEFGELDAIIDQLELMEENN